MRIAALDDEVVQLELIRHAVVGMGHACHVFTELSALRREWQQHAFDLLICDWASPNMPGHAVVNRLRLDRASALPALFVTPQHEAASVVEGLTLGTYDFINRPVRAVELQARVTALLQRTPHSRNHTKFSFGSYAFLPDTHTLQLNGKRVELEPREYQLALLLFSNLGQVLTREYLLTTLWSQANEDSSRSLDTHISQLRGRLALDPAHEFSLATVFGLGYRLVSGDASALRLKVSVGVLGSA